MRDELFQSACKCSTCVDGKGGQDVKVKVHPLQRIDDAAPRSQLLVAPLHRKWISPPLEALQ